MAIVFISYRRDDSGSEARLLRDALQREFGTDSVFLDTSSLQAGTIWPDELQEGLKRAQIVLAVIGPEWLRAGSDEWGQRRIDDEMDWVRQELAAALAEHKRVIPVLVRGAKVPPISVLPEPVRSIPIRQGIEIRRDYWDHDVKLLLAQVASEFRKDEEEDSLNPYPRIFPEGPDPLPEEKIQKVLGTELLEWSKVASPLVEDPKKVRTELFRELRFKSFREAVEFMNQVAPGCDIANHHPRWENIWKTVRVYLTTWDIGHRISDRDVQLARYFDRAYAEFPGAAQTTKAKS
jgi:pterin-4a-carbinolamine dehydratase